MNRTHNSQTPTNCGMNTNNNSSHMNIVAIVPLLTSIVTSQLLFCVLITSVHHVCSLYTTFMYYNAFFMSYCYPFSLLRSILLWSNRIYYTHREDICATLLVEISTETRTTKDDGVPLLSCFHRLRFLVF